MKDLRDLTDLTILDRQFPMIQVDVVCELIRGNLATAGSYEGGVSYDRNTLVAASFQ